MSNRPVTPEEIVAEAKKTLEAASAWPEKEARLRAANRDEARITVAHTAHETAERKVRELCEQVILVNLAALKYPASHGGNLDKPVLQEAAVAFFGFDVQIVWPR